MANWAILGVAIAGGMGMASAQDQPKTDPGGGAKGEPAPALVEFPHPLISEVLFNVPRGADGDANGDGKRDSNGDEFVELVNPHARAISLKGYVLLDAKGVAEVARRGAQKDAKAGADQGARPRRGNDRGASDVVFEFPDMTLQPGEVVVVFNGRDSTFKGPVGDTGRAPAKNDHFGGAYVVTMRVASKFMGLNNRHDCVVLRAPSGENVQVVSWGEPDTADQDEGEDRAGQRRGGDARTGEGRTADAKPKAPSARPPGLPVGTRNDKVTDTPRGSVQRVGVAGEFADHASLEGGHLFSPGVFPGTAMPPPPAEEGDSKPKGGPGGR